MKENYQPEIFWSLEQYDFLKQKVGSETTDALYSSNKESISHVSDL